ncbi:aconitase X swivel domain-containing protein [Acuticoccus kandeliae]|uniref:aconitase X swivel domain-containing protein n=1 Tax=Acuticoccus kandeliae TaxID=2073160 RepID=UPI000D3E0385|nr:DUF126 domain-containing protein [Acuticoccus kandeliae]
MTGTILYPGAGEGPVLRLAAPLSFWGGVDPFSGLIINARHPQRGVSVTGTCLVIDDLVGSSSSSAVMLELIRAGLAPAAIVLRAVDAILVVGCLAGRELGYACPPVIQVTDWPAAIAGGAPVAIEATGEIGEAAAIRPLGV